MSAERHFALSHYHRKPRRLTWAHWGIALALLAFASWAGWWALLGWG